VDSAGGGVFLILLALSHELLGVQRRALVRLRRDRRINDQVLRDLERDLDLHEARVG
jgi:hypothetical protein